MYGGVCSSGDSPLTRKLDKMVEGASASVAWGPSEVPVLRCELSRRGVMSAGELTHAGSWASEVTAVAELQLRMRRCEDSTSGLARSALVKPPNECRDAESEASSRLGESPRMEAIAPGAPSCSMES